MFRLRFVLECREAMRWANRLAHNLGQEFVDTPHLLDGLLMIDEGHASNIIKHLLGDYKAIRAEVWAMFPDRPDKSKLPRHQQIEAYVNRPAEVPRHQQTETYKRVIDRAMQLAEETGARVYTTGHMLAALADMAGDPAAEVLRRRGITREVVLDHIWVPRDA